MTELTMTMPCGACQSGEHALCTRRVPGGWCCDRGAELEQGRLIEDHKAAEHIGRPHPGCAACQGAARRWQLDREEQADKLETLRAAAVYVSAAVPVHLDDVPTGWEAFAEAMAELRRLLYLPERMGPDDWSAPTPAKAEDDLSGGDV